MKKTFLLIIAGVLAIALLSCSNSSHTSSGTSLVTIKVGSDKTASLSVQKATLFAKLKNFLADHLQVRSAEALIPSNVTSIQVTVWASDMPTIAQTINIAGLSSVTIIVEVPNGLNRLFAITGLDSANNITFAGGMSADLNGADVYLPVPMNNLGSVANILYVSTTGSNTTGDGTLQKPLRTISNALSLATATSGNTGILVWPGTYDTAGGEAYPLQLLPGSALACLGQDFSAMLVDTGTTTVTGAMVSVGVGASSAPAYIGGCDIYSTLGWSYAISDGGSILNVDHSFVHEPLGTTNCLTPNGINLSAAGSSVTNSQIVANPDCSAGYLNGIIIAANVSISGNSITGVYNGDAIYIQGGNPTITNNTISGNSIGVYVNDGSPTISNNIITNNGSGGIESYSNSSTVGPTVSNNDISGNYYGIYTYSGTWNISGNNIRNNTGYGIELYGLSNIGGTVTGNTIVSNGTGTSGYGIDLTGGSTITFPSINNNSLSCNRAADLNTNAATPINASSNAWDHSPPSAATAPCPAGTDICFSGTSPNFAPYTLVAAPCP